MLNIVVAVLLDEFVNTTQQSKDETADKARFRFVLFSVVNTKQTRSGARMTLRIRQKFTHKCRNACIWRRMARTKRPNTVFVFLYTIRLNNVFIFLYTIRVVMLLTMGVATTRYALKHV